MKPISDLDARFIDAQPCDVDWSEGFGETWDLVEPFGAMGARELAEWIADRGELPDPWALGEKGAIYYDGEPFDDDENAEEELRDHARECASPNDFAPMMNYVYPIGDDDAERMQATLERYTLPVVVVEYHGRPALALSGGGMDLSWEICEAYMRLGYLPPFHFGARLPPMADRAEKAPDLYAMARDLWILRGAEEACRIAEERARTRRERVERQRASVPVEAALALYEILELESES